MPSKPESKPVEARRQTQQKLETMHRYWRVWAKILAQSKGQFCRSDFWMVDTMAGRGLHDSATSPDGAVPGTPMQAVLAAQFAQRLVPGATFHVRAIDKDKAFAADLERLVAPLRGEPPDGVDVAVYPEDWVDVVPRISAEIGGPPTHTRSHGWGAHNHASLWFIDPYGVEPLDYRIIDALPHHSEVIVNFDVNATRRHAGKGLELLYKVFRDPKWQGIEHGTLEEWAQSFEDQFPAFSNRKSYPLRASGSQDRFFVQLAGHPKALEAFGKCVKNGLRAGTLIADSLLTMQEKQAISRDLFEVYKGTTVSVSAMYEAGGGLQKKQIRAIAEVLDGEFGWYRPKVDEIEWFTERRARKAESNAPNLELGL
ncbi:MAG TPA: three-Cys-motif partner protein TcmP [Candidatus Limnocylindrales bacterium]|nr:three-Cys-motif partner protein TcmP [Candidatus Limnocylindrales bacterium]